MRTIRLVLSVVAALALAGCIMLKNDDWIKLQQDIAALKSDRDLLKSDIQEVQKSTLSQLSTRIAATEDSLSSLEKDLRSRQAGIVADIGSIRSDFQLLTGRFEEVRYSLQKSAQEGKVAREDADSRQRENAQRLEDLQKRVAALEQSLVLLRQGREGGIEASGEKAAEVPGLEDAYKAAYEAYQKGDYKASREKFQKYMEAFPNSKYSENAQYWIGESYYKEKSYERAIVEFDDVVKKFPAGSKASAALFKQAMAFSELGDKKNASIIFKRIVESYPKSEQAEMAKKKLKE